jgi:hypothetical protein
MGKKLRKRGRPASGSDPLRAVRLPKKLLRAIDAWIATRPGMSWSKAIRCLIFLGLDAPKYLVVDPKDGSISEGMTPSLAKFYRRAERKWTPKGPPPQQEASDSGPPATYKPNRRPRQPTKMEIQAVFERADARSRAKNGADNKKLASGSPREPNPKTFTQFAQKNRGEPE